MKPRYEQAYLDCQRDWALVNILELYDAHLSVPYLARQILSTAQKHHFTDLIVSTASLLRKKAANEGDRKGFDKYVEVLDAFLPVLQAEQKAVQIHQEMGLLKWEDQIFS